MNMRNLRRIGYAGAVAMASYLAGCQGNGEGDLVESRDYSPSTLETWTDQIKDSGRSYEGIVDSQPPAMSDPKDF